MIRRNGNSKLAFFNDFGRQIDNLRKNSDWLIWSLAQGMERVHLSYTYASTLGRFQPNFPLFRFGTPSLLYRPFPFTSLILCR